MRGNCKECPWIKDNPHSIKFRGYAHKMKDLKKIENHKCHMIDKDVWGSKSEVGSENVCFGSKTYLK